MSSIFSSVKIGNYEIKNRIAMAPMTRTRSPFGIPTEQNALYYKQRASVGLIISEGTAISPTSMGYLHIPGIYNAAQIKAWKKVTQAVHESNGIIFMQLWHVGRISHYSNQPNQQQPLAPSAIIARDSYPWGIENGKEGRVAAVAPRALEKEEIQDIIRDFANGAKNAIAAGFDGVEIHGANGYLLEQFLNPCSNIRTDEYGGSIENRCRIVIEILEACIAAVGSHKVGIRLSPYGFIHDMQPYEELEDTYEYLAKAMNKMDLAYVHFNSSGILLKEKEDFIIRFRAWYDGALMIAGELTREKAQKLLDKGLIDMAAFGRPLISNPDLVDRLKNNLRLTPPNPETFYGTGTIGYTDYKTYAEMDAMERAKFL